MEVDEVDRGVWAWRKRNGIEKNADGELPNQGFLQLRPIRGVPSAVTVTIRKDWDNLKAAYEQCQTDRTAIDGQLTVCQASQ